MKEIDVEKALYDRNVRFQYTVQEWGFFMFNYGVFRKIKSYVNHNIF